MADSLFLVRRPSVPPPGNRWLVPFPCVPLPRPCIIKREHIDAFLDYLSVERRLSENTIQSYELDLLQFTRMLPCKLEAATRDQIRQVFSELQSSGIKPRSIARKISTLRHFYAWARRKGLCPCIPLANIPLPKLPVRVVKPVTDGEFKKLVAVIDTRTPEGLREMAIVRVLDACGLRASELTGLTFDNLHLEDRYITVLRTKFDKDRDVPMDAAAASALRDYLACSRPVLYSRGRWAKGDRVFPITRQRLQQIIRDLSRSAGIPVKKHPHQFRHRLASGLIQAGVDVAVVRDILGHSCSESTVRTYVHLDLNFVQRHFRKAHPRAKGVQE